YFFFFFLLISAVSFGQVVINEIDADTPGTDTAEFIELKGTPNASLDGLVVVLYNGSNDTSYAAFDLDGKTLDANGFFILANTGLISGQDIDLGASNALQNGADAVAVYTANDTDFPNGTAVTSTNLVDAIVYGTGDADDAELLTGLGETTQYDESLNGASDSESLQLNNAGTSYDTKVPTFRLDNNAAVCDLSLTTTSATCDASTTGTDTYTATVDFSGGGTSTYTVSADSGVISGDDPSSVATGTITVTGVTEGVDVTINVTNGGLCDLNSTITSPICEPTQTLPLYENFNYGSSAGDLTAVSGGNWVNHSGSTPVGYATTSLSMSGYASSGVGGSATITGSNSEDVNRSFTEQTSGTVYFSALVNISAVGTGNYFFHLKDNSTAFVARIGAKDDGSGNILFGIGTSSSTLTYGTTSYNLNTTYLVVGSYNIDTGVSNLYVLTTPSATEPSTPEATNSGNVGTPISSVALRQSSNIPTAVIDGINVATNWAAVTLSTGNFSINNFKVYPNPTSTGFVNISSSNSENISVAVFDILGKQVINKTISNNRLNVSALNSGIYIMKISQNNATVTKKLVIK
ncbi:MAG: T9SS type A sorting domain-containing protein, partial [Gelidibacter sp.]|nr:T9SS type A sorting domain-containing protein [Gelidibacter sp.]